ncbi:telomere repeats-binding bouquet formation protein 1 isoform X1 [Leuresthes tenuis]|uniref:telomere repeats-binding bouquet formation protein 1 isoform X1 n=1 Tax=Leuresthes tenuis TaxID=355514 RepID=UPI003B50C6C6
MLFVLVANNKSGQTLAQATGCLDILLNLFRTTFPISTGENFRIASQTYQLWASLSSALCGCVNNPQNEDAQRICVAAFPKIKIWLQQISLPCTEIFQPICSFIAMTVANNSCVQESFSASGGLETLTLALVHQASAADTSLLSCQLSVIISKTLSACITDNSALAAGLARYGVVSHLFCLLTSSHMDPDDRLAVLLSIGQCTQASEHQSQLVQCGGLPLIITFLTEDTSEEVRKAAAFILQTCKKATMCFGVPGLIAKHAENEEPLTDMEGFKSSARELLRRIGLLEKRQLKEVKDEQEDINPSNSIEGQVLPSLYPALLVPPQRRESIKTIHRLKNAQQVNESSIKPQTDENMVDKGIDSEIKKFSINLNLLEEKTKSSGGDVRCSVCKGGGAQTSSHVRPLERGSELNSVNNESFKPPLPVWQTKPKESECTDDLQDVEKRGVEKIPAEEHSVSHIRCAGCALPFNKVTSRTFASLQSSCRNSCDMHRVLQEATEQFSMHRFNIVLMKEHQGDAVEHSEANTVRVSAANSHRSCVNWSGISLTPLRRRAEKETVTSHCRIGLAPLKRQHSPEDGDPTLDRGRRGKTNSVRRAVEEQSKRRKRQDFSHEEVRYLLSGVKKYGFSWNSILWSYPFQPGRTNVDLAKKYRRLMVT